MASTDAPDLTKAEFESVLAVASDWAGDNCYLPCEFPMCGAVIDLKPGTVGVYIRPLDPLEGGIYPEAGVEIELSSMTVTAADLLHTGCQYWTGTYKPKWSGRQM